MDGVWRVSIWSASAGLAVLLAIFGDRIAGEAREFFDAPLSRFVSSEAEAAVRTACASKAPFVVLDTFSVFKPANIDDNLADPAGEGPAGPQHGDLVAAIVEASHPGTEAYQIDPVFNVSTLAADLQRLANDVETRRIATPAAVVSSIVLPIDIAQLNARGTGVAAFTERDVAARRDEALRVATNGFDERNPYTAIDRQLRRLRLAGVPVFVAAGNTGPDATLNVLALSEGVYAVGALGRDGERTPYTSAPDFVSVWSPGYVVVTEAPGGLSVSGGRGVELKGAGLPDQKAVIESYAGRRARDVVHDVPEEVAYVGRLTASRMRNLYLNMVLEPGLYRTSELMAAYGYPETSGNVARAVAEGPFMHFPSDTIFKADIDGVLSFDPLGDRTPGQLQVEDATSFAAPNICATARRGAVAWAGR